MRAIERTRRFKRDYKRESRGRHRADLDKRLAEIVQALAADTPLDPHYHDHALSGPWTDFRDCHLRPDLILIYQKPDAHTLRLVRIGSHAELGL
ncbi:MAG: type II toxin-antitoxin system YafQ family toxin [Chromatiales bacterium]|nr:type II toxin-antitoxin system YafQ family toxin [Chromatiales bacterium]